MNFLSATGNGSFGVYPLVNLGIGGIPSVAAEDNQHLPKL